LVMSLKTLFYFQNQKKKTLFLKLLSNNSKHKKLDKR